jgi:hypothetical protein
MPCLKSCNWQKTSCSPAIFLEQFVCVVWWTQKSSWRLMGPHVLETRVSGRGYLNFLPAHLSGLLYQDVSLNARRFSSFQRDAVPPLCSHKVRQWLSKNYLGPWIGLEGDAPVSWPTRSTNFNPLGFSLLWGILKTTVYVSTVSTREEHWSRSQEFVSKIENISGII